MINVYFRCLLGMYLTRISSWDFLCILLTGYWVLNRKIGANKWGFWFLLLKVYSTNAWHGSWGSCERLEGYRSRFYRIAKLPPEPLIKNADMDLKMTMYRPNVPSYHYSAVCYLCFNFSRYVFCFPNSCASSDEELAIHNDTARFWLSFKILWPFNDQSEPAMYHLLFFQHFNYFNSLNIQCT